MEKYKKWVYGIFFTILIGFLFYNFTKGSGWVLDNSIAIVLLVLIYELDPWLRLRFESVVMLSVFFILHNLGSFGCYELSWLIFSWDNLIHLTGSFTASYAVFNFVSTELHIKKRRRLKKSIIDDHKAILIFLTIASVAMFGTIVEICEFAGFLHMGSERTIGGMLNVDAEESLAAKEYIDTMTDIFLNTLGSIAGVLVYYFALYRKRPWLEKPG